VGSDVTVAAVEAVSLRVWPEELVAAAVTTVDIVSLQVLLESGAVVASAVVIAAVKVVSLQF
jgi:hypothetical protein